MNKPLIPIGLAAYWDFIKTLYNGSILILIINYPVERMPSQKRKSILTGISLLTFLACSTLAIYVWTNWDKPLAPALDLSAIPTRTVSQSAAPETGESSPNKNNPQTNENPPTDADGKPAVVQNPKPVCGGPENMVFLVIATDTEDENYLYGLADAIRLVYLDFVAQRVVVFALPRDLWVEIPGISDHYNITHGKLNQAYLYGNPGFGYYDGPGAGPGLLALTIAHNFNIYADHYGAISMRTFVDIVDMMGGIDLYLDEPVNGNDDGGLENYFSDLGFFPAGHNHLTGQQALNFSRIRSIDSTIGRQDRQSQVLMALRDKFMSIKGVSKTPRLIKAFIGRAQTDLSFEMLTQIACLGSRVQNDQILIRTIPGNLLNETTVYSEQLKGNTFIFEADPVLVGNFISELFFETQ